MLNTPIRLVSILPILLLIAALIATACESATQTPNDASQNNAIAAAAPTASLETIPTPQRTQTPTPTASPELQVPCEPGISYHPDTPGLQACLAQKEDVCPPGSNLDPPDLVIDGVTYIKLCDHPPSPTPVYQKLTGGLSQVAEVYERGGSARSAASSAFGDEYLRNDDLLTVVIIIDRDPKELVIWLNDQGAEFGSAHGTVLVDEEWLSKEGGEIDDYYAIILLDEYIRGEAELEEPYEGGMTDILAAVPVSLLVRLSEQPGVIQVRRPFPAFTPDQPDPTSELQEASKPALYARQTTAPIVSEGLSVHGVSSWHNAGNKGSDVKIGIIDPGFHGLAEIMRNGDFPPTIAADRTRCYEDYNDSSPSFSHCRTGNNRHGASAAEIIYDIAPNATYYIARTHSEIQFREAVRWMVSEDVDVISHSQFFAWDGPGDGTSQYTSSPLNVVATAVSGGTTYVGIAGNEAKKTWFGEFDPSSNDQQPLLLVSNNG